MMTLAVMTRASLGHTGQPLIAGAGTQAIYLFAFCAAMLRIVAAFDGSMVLDRARERGLGRGLRRLCAYLRAISGGLAASLGRSKLTHDDR